MKDRNVRKQNSFEFENKRPVKKIQFQLPELNNADELGIMVDEDLIAKLHALEAERDKVIDAKCDPRPWEEESCYIKRELQIRRHRRELHDEYLRELDRENEEAKRLEDSYPVADLDNSAYMFWDDR